MNANLPLARSAPGENIVWRVHLTPRKHFSLPDYTRSVAGNAGVWANPFKIDWWYRRLTDKPWYEQRFETDDPRFYQITSPAESLEWYKWLFQMRDVDVMQLRGINLACHCTTNNYCHAYWLMLQANRGLPLNERFLIVFNYGFLWRATSTDSGQTYRLQRINKGGRLSGFKERHEELTKHHQIIRDLTHVELSDEVNLLRFEPIGDKTLSHLAKTFRRNYL